MLSLQLTGTLEHLMRDTSSGQVCMLLNGQAPIIVHMHIQVYEAWLQRIGQTITVTLQSER
jgi:hypothetical protein